MQPMDDAVRNDEYEVVSTETDGMVFDIQRFSIHDGPGIRTTVFLKGCPLRCLWCHNPESQDPGREISYSETRCIGCGRCVEVCPTGSHTLENGVHLFDRESCTRCGTCAEACYSNALESVGRRMNVTEVLEEVLRDEPFYKTSGGGMTLSGGEPLAQFEFSRQLLAAAKKSGLHTAIETSGYAPVGRLSELIELVDLFLFDIKESDTKLHSIYVGVVTDLIQRNLTDLDRCGAQIVIRCPIIPGLNDRSDHFRGIAEVANRLDHLEEIHVLPYHPLGRDKSAQIGKQYELGNIGFPDDSAVESWVSEIADQTRIRVKRN